MLVTGYVLLGLCFFVAGWPGTRPVSWNWRQRSRLTWNPSNKASPCPGYC